MNTSRSERQYDWPVTVTEDEHSGWWLVRVYGQIKVNCRSFGAAERVAARIYADREAAALKALEPQWRGGGIMGRRGA